MKHSLCVALGIITVHSMGCRSESDGPSPVTGDGTRVSYLVSAEADGLTFLLGREGIDELLPVIRDGGKVEEKWTLIRVHPSAADPSAARGDLDLAQAAVDVSHEFKADDPYLEGLNSTWFRINFTTQPGLTIGRMTFDRTGGPDSRVDIQVEFEGENDVYKPGTPTYTKFAIVAGFPLVPSERPQ
ncbi:MAG: hypothetical protein K8M05_22165 [Deltaproteobacteria bacterium]|nr:hypothetical protein [Kofleriaceae bacterium]